MTRSHATTGSVNVAHCACSRPLSQIQRRDAVAPSSVSLCRLVLARSSPRCPTVPSAKSQSRPSLLPFYYILNQDCSTAAFDAYLPLVFFIAIGFATSLFTASLHRYRLIIYCKGHALEHEQPKHSIFTRLMSPTDIRFCPHLLSATQAAVTTSATESNPRRFELVVYRWQIFSLPRLSTSHGSDHCIVHEVGPSFPCVKNTCILFAC